ncbi:uncharacterized protein [Linepithema humile]|uniref:uncharacterized protein isoform X2 n=1 Tax=Linepithema humile TaxID=83485 RepID=UPI00351DE618
MLCCVPKRLADGGPFHDEAPFHNEVRFRDEALNRPTSIREVRFELYAEEGEPANSPLRDRASFHDAPPPILLPCAICARTFMPQSLEKHARICERAASKKRKPFDSAKQRIQGTELAEFLPKPETRRYHQDERNSRPSWKKTHDDFLRTIREARGEVMDDSHKQCNSLISSGAPTRSNEKGTCPTCNRHFGIKAYDRHVAWCKDRVTQMPVSPATNLAKERLEARMRYKVPTLKNRRAINREKYSPGSAANQAAKTSQSSPALVKPKESASVTNCSRESPIKQKSAIIRRPGQLKESPTPSGPMKSRLADRINRPVEDHDSLPTSYRSSHFATSSRRSLPFAVPPVSLRINDPVSSNEITSSIFSSKKQSNRNKTTCQHVLNDKMSIREACSARTSRNIVSARSQGHPRINDIAVNDKSLGMTVQPCRIHADTPKDDHLVTWKQISRKKDSFQANHNFSQEFQLDLDLTVESKDDLSITKNDFVRADDEVKDDEIDKVENDIVTWLGGIENLNQTYLIRDSLDDFDQLEIFHSKPIKHNPYVEFYFMDKKDEEIKIAEREVEELKMNTDSKIIEKNTDNKIKERKTEELQIINKDNWKMSGFEESEEIKCKIEKLNMEDEDKEINQEASNKKAKIKEHVKKIEIKLENKEDIPKMNDVNIVELDKLNINERDKDQQTTMNDESTKYPEIREIEQNLFDFDKLSQDSPQKYEKLFSKEVKKFTNNNNFILDKESSHFRHEEHSAVHLDRSLAFSDSFINQSQDYPRLKKKMSQYKSNACCSNSLELKKNMTTCNYHRFDKNNILLNNNEINCNLNPENEVFLYQNNICRNSSDLQENKKILSPSVLCAIDSAERNFAEETEKYERYENDLIIFDEKSEKSLEESKNSEISPPQDSKVVAENCLNIHMDNKLQIETDRKHQEKLFNSENFENIKKDEKTDLADADNCFNDKTRFYRLIAETKVTTDEGLRMKSVNNFACDNDNAMCEGHNTRGANDLESSITSKDIEKSRRHRGGILSKNVKFSEHVSDPTRRAIKERPLNSVEMKHKIQENMNLLRGSTDSLISSVEFVELASIRRPEANSAYERETIEIIRPSRRCRAFRDLPDIRDDSAETRKAAERNSYWEKVPKISRSRLIDLNPSCRYRLARRNSRVRILPPVSSPSLINRRKNDLATRPAWCSYVRRRPDFNLVLKARTGTCKDYDPFLLAEQQMNDLLSDTSDQSATGNAKQTRDILYPLSHSSAFVKYPSSDRRSSLIAPPSEFDDLFSNFSSDSTETNSISREVFLKSEVLANSKDVTDLASTKPVKELGRRVIIDKSKALGVDDRRGALGSADRIRKALDKVSPKVTRPLIDRSNSIRASSAPRIGSGADRKTSVDIRKNQNSKLVEGQRSSDQSLNQRNNNYSSLSGSNLSLSSIISSELDVKRSHSMFDELTTSFEEDTFPALRSFLNNESFNLSSSMHDGDRQRNGSLISDEELSSPDSYKPQDHSKLSNDSAYSSLNRKYSHHGRSTNDMASRLDEDVTRNGTPIQTAIKYKMSKFCHECGQRFPETAKFCCECGVRRLAL